MVNIYYNSGFLTRSFCDIFLPAKEETDKTSYDKFREMFNDSGIPLKITEENLETLFYLLYAKHGSDPISNPDENQFKYDLQSRIFMYGPAWQKRLQIQNEIISLTVDDVVKGGEAIYNTAQAPGTAIAGLVDSEGKLDFLNSQNTTTYKKTKLEGLASLNALIEKDVTKEFLNRFKDLFMVVPVRSHIPTFITEKEEE